LTKNVFFKGIKKFTSVCHIDRHKYSDGSRSGYNTVYSGRCSLRIVNWNLKMETWVSSKIMETICHICTHCNLKYYTVYLHLQRNLIYHKDLKISSGFEDFHLSLKNFI